LLYVIVLFLCVELTFVCKLHAQCMSLWVTAQPVHTLIQVFRLTTHLTLFVSVIKLWLHLDAHRSG
jgi:hypothetical protein